jgi:hypothetical protein
MTFLIVFDLKIICLVDGIGQEFYHNPGMILLYRDSAGIIVLEIILFIQAATHII